MINFRFHIVSLTAVLLAFGIGLLLGTAFFDDATVNFLRGQLDDLESDLTNAESDNRDLQGELNGLNEEDLALDQHLGERVLADQLDGDPVLLIAPNDVQNDLVERSADAIQQAGADYLGAWRLTDRLVLDDTEEVDDLAGALDEDGDDVERLRETLASQLAQVLGAATDPAGSTQAEGIVGAAAQPSEPALLTRLREAGFVDYDLAEDAGSDQVLLPQEGLRILVVTGQDAAVPDADVLAPTLAQLAADGPVPLVATMPTAADEQPEDDSDVEPSTLLPAILDDESLSERVSTVDDLDRVAGRIAVVLALQDADPAGPAVGHYGLGDGADSLLPPVREEG
jgi:copper transport outer membrane protein MctB